MVFLSDFADPADWVAMYRDHDLQAMPAVPGEKRPLAAWREFQHNLIPTDVIDRWYGPQGEHRKSLTMGLLTGACSRAGLGDKTSGLMLTDLDVKDADGLAWWRTFVEVHLNGIEPQTWRARTPSGGEHVFFAAPPDWTAPTIKFPTFGVDIRGQGGFVMTAPSARPDGKVYEWIEGCAPWECELAMAPRELCDVIDAMRAVHTPSSGPSERVAATTAKDAWGHDVDGREEKLRDMVWAAVVDLYRECPIPPSQDVQEAEIERLFGWYEQTTRSRLPRDPGVTNAELLEREGRGISELRAKWAYTMTKWDTTVAEAARVPKAETWSVDPAGPVTLAAPDTPDPSDSRAADKPDDNGQSLGDVTARPAPRLWVVANWIPQGEVTLIASNPGLGKSLLALQLACSTAIGSPWLGLDVTQGSSLFVTCEDNKGEVETRFADVKDGMGVALSAPFAPVVALYRRHKENRLTQRGQHGVLGLGPYYEELSRVLAYRQPDLLILDTLADFFTGNENDRSEVNWFVKTMLGGFIAASNNRLSVVVLGHTSKAVGSEFSGSSAWEGAVRSRLFFDRPKEGGSTERTLTRSKANYAGGDDDTLALMWEGGMLRALSETPSGQMVQLMHTVANEVAWMHGQGRAYTSIPGAASNIYRALPRKLDMGPQQTAADVREALRRAVLAKAIIKTAGQNPVWKRGETAWEA